jgi:hypothetical protein
MADPLTLGIAAAVGTVVSAAGALASGNAAAGQARAQAQAAQYNAVIAHQNATLVQQEAAVDADQAYRTGERKAGAAAAAAGASGLKADASIGDILGDLASSSELDRLLAQHKGAVAALGFENSAYLDTKEAETKSTLASSAETAGYLSAAGTLLKGGANIAANYDIYEKLKQSN